MQIEMSCGVTPHYKLGKINSNFVLKFLFNVRAKKMADEWISLSGLFIRKSQRVAWATRR
jgi:hypothetical protein